AFRPHALNSQPSVNTPLVRRMRREQRAAKASSWVTTIKAVPCSRASAIIISKTPSAVNRSRLPVGSSANTQAGCVTRAPALAARQFGRPVQQAFPQTDPLQNRSRLLTCSDAVHAPYPQRHRHVVLRAELGQQMVELVNKTQVLIAQLALLRR